MSYDPGGSPVVPSPRASFHVSQVEIAPHIRLEVETGGPAGAPVIVFLHGGGQTRHAWKAAGKQAVEAGYRVLMFDARGHGGSDWSPDGDYSMAALTSDLQKLVSGQRRPFALVGASMGGMTAFLFAGREPESVAALVLVDIVPKINATGADRIRQFMTSHSRGFATLEEAADAVAAYNPARPRPADISGLMRYLRKRDDGRLHWHWDPLLLSTPRVEPPRFEDEAHAASPTITAPTLLVRGMQSDVVDDAGVRDLQAHVPQTEIFEVEGAGHMVAGDRNDVFTEGVLAFLGRHFPAAERP